MSGGDSPAGPAPQYSSAGHIGRGVRLEKPLAFRGTLRRLLSLLRPERAMLIVVLVAVTVATGLFVLGPMLLGRATDVVFSGVVGARFPAGTSQQQAVEQLRASGDDVLANMLTSMRFVPGEGVDFGKLAQLLLWTIVIHLAAWGLSITQARLTTRLVQRTIYRLRESVQGKLSRLPLSYFDGQPRGEILSRATNDTDNIALTLQQTFSVIIASLLTVIGILTMMVWISPLLALVAVLSVPVSIWVTARIVKRAQPEFRQQWARTGKINGHTEEMITGHVLVKAFGRQSEAAEAFDEHNEALFASSYKAQALSGLIQPLLAFLGNINYVLIAVVGALRVTAGAISLGEVQAFIQYSRQFTYPLTQVATMSNLLQSGLASAERVFALLDADEQSPDPARPVRPEPVRGRVAFENISFRYEPDRPLIENLSLTAEPGHVVAIVGPTGAGKTTLVNLLMRFYDVTEGRITLDGVDITEMSREELRGNIGMVLQDTWLFGGTIADNIAYGAASSTHEEVVEAAEAAHADRFVRTLPNGYATILSDDGGGVSAGEKQLITIARAFRSDPTVLVLDEATSSVDTRTETLIQGGMNTLRVGRTSFVIAHRLSTIRDANTILVMESGRIVQQGTHDELIAVDGVYSRLYAAQFAQAMDA